MLCMGCATQRSYGSGLSSWATIHPGYRAILVTNTSGHRHRGRNWAFLLLTCPRIAVFSVLVTGVCSLWCHLSSVWVPSSSSVPAAGDWAVIVLSNPIDTVDSVWACDGNRVYGCGWSDLHSLDVSTGQWEALPPTVTPRFCPSLSVVNGQLFVAGGIRLGPPYEFLASVETYVPQWQKWEQQELMPAEICDAAALAFNGKLLIIGGTSQNGQTLDTVHQYTPEDCTWKGLPNLLTARTGCMATVFRGEIVVLGGNDRYGVLGAPVLSGERLCHKLQCWKPFGSGFPFKLQYMSKNYPAVLVLQQLGQHSRLTLGRP